MQSASVGGQIAGGDDPIADMGFDWLVFQNRVTCHGIAYFRPVHMNVILLYTAVGDEEHDGRQAWGFIGVGIQIFVEFVAQRVGRWKDEVGAHPRGPSAYFGWQ